jgi:diacylglycerol kinase (ATP)
MRYRNVLGIVNPVAGQSSGLDKFTELARRLREDGAEVGLVQTTGAGDAFHHARSAGEKGHDLVVAIGGDGTVQEVASGLAQAERRPHLAHVPVGTANLFARAFQLPGNPDRAYEVLRDGRPLALDIGYLPTFDRYFVLAATAGWSARLIQDAGRRQKDRLGFFAYVVAGIRHLAPLRSSRVVLQVGERRLRTRASSLLIMTVGDLGFGLEFDPDTDPSDGKLDVAVIATPSPWRMLYLALRVLLHRHDRTRELRRLHVPRLAVEARPALPLQIDGEVIGSTPFVVEVRHAAYELVVPAKVAAREAGPGA